jgi:regulator of replication initiation timing
MSYKQTNSGNQSGDCGCIDLDSPTQKDTINKLRDKYCSDLYEWRGKVSELEVKKASLDKMICQKQCWFVWTERHYRIHRNLGLMVTTELVQTNDSIKQGVKNYMDTNKTLADALKKLSKSLKDVKDKTHDLRGAACKLKDCKDDKCNCAQIYELTGEKPEGGCQGNQGNNNSKPDRSSPCSYADIKKIIDDLICMPKSLSADVDTIFTSSLDVGGIQTFSNINTLDPLQSELSTRIQKFDKQIQDIVKQGDTDLKAILDELTKSKKELAKTEVDLYAKRSDFEGLKDAVVFYCCPNCNCVVTYVTGKNDCEKRLDCCGKDICEICNSVQTASCTPASTSTQTQTTSK